MGCRLRQRCAVEGVELDGLFGSKEELDWTLGIDVVVAHFELVNQG